MQLTFNRNSGHSYSEGDSSDIDIHFSMDLIFHFIVKHDTASANVQSNRRIYCTCRNFGEKDWVFIPNCPNRFSLVVNLCGNNEAKNNTLKMPQQSRKDYRISPRTKARRRGSTYWGWVASSSWWYCWSSSWALFQLFATWQLAVDVFGGHILLCTRNNDSNGTRESMYSVSLCLIKYSPQLLHQSQRIMRFLYSPFLQWSLI